MRVVFKENYITVYREDCDPRKMSRESTLYFNLVKELKRHGYDVVRVKMKDDGHLMGDDDTWYVRTKNIKPNKPSFYIYDEDYAIRNPAYDLTRTGTVKLKVVYGVSSNPQDDIDREKSMAYVFSRERLFMQENTHIKV